METVSPEMLLLGIGMGMLIAVLTVIARASNRHERGGGPPVPSKTSLDGRS